MTAAADDAALLREALQLGDELLRRDADMAVYHVGWTPPQLALLQADHPRVLLRTGNQFGKTWGGIGEVIYHCLGRHPYKEVPPPPVEWWILTASWLQSVSIQQKLWKLLPKSALHEETEYDPVRGFRGRHPTVRFLNGSLIRIKTARQGGLALAGATLHGVMVDEPPPSARIYGEIERRLTRTGGRLIMTLTPVNADVSWLQTVVAEEESPILDLHFRMEPENFVPAGAEEPLRTEKGELMDAQWIAAQRATVLSWEAPVILDGEFEFKATDRVFEAYNPDVHLVPGLMQSGLMPEGVVELSLGMDFGESALRTCAVEVYIDPTGPHPRIFVVGEYAPTGATTEDMDARGVVRMLARNGDRWQQLDYAWSDKKYSGRSTRKSARSMHEAIDRELATTGELTTAGELRPSIRVAKRGAGAGNNSLWPSVRFLHDCMLRPGHFYVDSSCAWLHKSLLNWDGREKHEAKDIIDALRYAVRHLWWRNGPKPKGRVIQRQF